MVAGVKTTLQWLLPSTAYHHRHVIVGRSLCITCSILPILILPIVHSFNYFCPSGHLAEGGGCGHLQSKVEVPTYEGSWADVLTLLFCCNMYRVLQNGWWSCACFSLIRNILSIYLQNYLTDISKADSLQFYMHGCILVDNLWSWEVYRMVVHTGDFPRGVGHRVENGRGLTKVAVVLLNGLIW